MPDSDKPTNGPLAFITLPLGILAFLLLPSPLVFLSCWATGQVRFAEGVLYSLLGLVGAVLIFGLMAGITWIGEQLPKEETAGVEGCRARLQRAGWCLGESHDGGRWIVQGTLGERTLRADGQTRAEAWERACEQAAALRLLGA